MKVYRHKITGQHYRLVEERFGQVNVYLEVDCNNMPIRTYRKWRDCLGTQKATFIGFDKLELV